MENQDYVTNTYNALKQKVQGFDKTEQQYRDLILNNPEYRANVHKALTQKVEGFNRTPEEFDSMIGLKKKVLSDSEYPSPDGTLSLQDRSVNTQPSFDTPQPPAQKPDNAPQGVSQQPQVQDDKGVLKSPLHSGEFQDIVKDIPEATGNEIKYMLQPGGNIIGRDDKGVLGTANQYIGGFAKAFDRSVADIFKTLDFAMNKGAEIIGKPIFGDQYEAVKTALNAGGVNTSPFGTVANAMESVYKNAPDTPNTIPGKITDAVGSIIPEIVASTFLPEVKVTGWLSKYGITGVDKFAMYLAGKEGLTSLQSAEGTTPIEQATALMEGAAKGFTTGLLYASMGKVAGEIGNKVTGKIFGKQPEGLLLKGKQIGWDGTSIPNKDILNRMLVGGGTSTLSNALLFGGYSALEELIRDGKITSDNVATNMGIGLALGAKDMGKLAYARGMESFIAAPKQTIDDVARSKSSPEEMKAMSDENLAELNRAVEQLQNGQQPDVDVQQKAVEAATSDNLANLKAFTQDVVQNPERVVEEVKQSDLPDQAKQELIDKINQTAIDNHPKTIETEPIRQEISDLEKQRDELNRVQSDSPVKTAKTQEITSKILDLKGQVDEVMNRTEPQPAPEPARSNKPSGTDIISLLDNVESTKKAFEEYSQNSTIPGFYEAMWFVIDAFSGERDAYMVIKNGVKGVVNFNKDYPKDFYSFSDIAKMFHNDKAEGKNTELVRLVEGGFKNFQRIKDEPQPTPETPAELPPPPADLVSDGNGNLSKIGSEQAPAAEQPNYQTSAILPKKLVTGGDNKHMTEDELLLFDAKVEKIISNPRSDISDRERIIQGNAFYANELNDIQKFIDARRNGTETRTFTEWRKDTRNTNNPQSTATLKREQLPENQANTRTDVTKKLLDHLAEKFGIEKYEGNLNSGDYISWLDKAVMEIKARHDIALYDIPRMLTQPRRVFDLIESESAKINKQAEPAPAPESKPTVAPEAEVPPKEPVKAVKFYDSFKKNNAPRIQIVDGYGRERTVFSPDNRQDYMDVSDETGRKVRWGVELSDGRTVSLDGLLRITNPEAWDRLKHVLKGKKIADKNLIIFKNTLTRDQLEEMITGIYEELKTNASSESFRGRDENGNRIITIDIDGIKANKLLTEIGHPLAGLFGYNIKTIDGKEINPSGFLTWLADNRNDNAYYRTDLKGNIQSEVRKTNGKWTDVEAAPAPPESEQPVPPQPAPTEVVKPAENKRISDTRLTNHAESLSFIDEIISDFKDGITAKKINTKDIDNNIDGRIVKVVHDGWNQRLTNEKWTVGSFFAGDNAKDAGDFYTIEQGKNKLTMADIAKKDLILDVIENFDFSQAYRKGRTVNELQILLDKYRFSNTDPLIESVFKKAQARLDYVKETDQIRKSKTVPAPEVVTPVENKTISDERMNDQPSLWAMRRSEFPKYNTNSEIVNLNAFVDNIRKLDPEDKLDRHWIKQGYNFETRVSYPHSLGENGYSTEFVYKEKPTVNDLKTDIKNHYKNEITNLKGKELSYGGYAISGKDENVISELEKALFTTVPAPEVADNVKPQTPVTDGKETQEGRQEGLLTEAPQQAGAPQGAPAKPVTPEEVKAKAAEAKNPDVPLKVQKKDLLGQIDEAIDVVLGEEKANYETLKKAELGALGYFVNDETVQKLKDAGFKLEQVDEYQSNHKGEKTLTGKKVWQVEFDVEGDGTFKLNLNSLDDSRVIVEKNFPTNPKMTPNKVEGLKSQTNRLGQSDVDEIVDNYWEAARVGNKELAEVFRKQLAENGVSSIPPPKQDIKTEYYSLQRNTNDNKKPFFKPEPTAKKVVLDIPGDFFIVKRGKKYDIIEARTGQSVTDPFKFSTNEKAIIEQTNEYLKDKVDKIESAIKKSIKENGKSPWGKQKSPEKPAPKSDNKVTELSKQQSEPVKVEPKPEVKEQTSTSDKPLWEMTQKEVLESIRTKPTLSVKDDNLYSIGKNIMSSHMTVSGIPANEVPGWEDAILRHAEAVKEAVSEGKNVPENVLNEFPELKKKVASSQLTETRSQRIESEKKQAGEFWSDSFTVETSDKYYSDLEQHMWDGGKISRDVYNDLTEDQKYHFDKHFNHRGDKIVEAKTPDLSTALISKLTDLKDTNRTMDGLTTMGHRSNELWNTMIDNVISIINENRNVVNRVGEIIEKFKQSDFYKSLSAKEKQDADDDISTIVGEVGKIEPEQADPPVTDSKSKYRDEATGIDTSLKRAVADNEKMQREGTDAVDYMVESLQSTNVQDIVESAKQSVNSGKVDPKEVTTRIIKEKTGTAQDEAVLLYERARLRNRELDLMNKISESDGKQKEVYSQDLIKLYDEMGRNDLAAATIGREASTIFRLRQAYMDSEYSLFSLEREYKSANDIDEMTPEQKQYVDEQYKALKTAEAKVRDLETKLKEENQKLKDQQLINSIREESLKNRPYKPEYKDVKKRFNVIADRIEKGLIGQDIMMSSIPFAKDVWNLGVKTTAETVRLIGDVAQGIVDGLAKIRQSDWYKELSEENKKKAEDKFTKTVRDYYRNEEESLRHEKPVKEKAVRQVADNDVTNGKIPIPTKLIKELVAGGIDNIEDLTQAVKREIQYDYPDATDRQIRDAITDYGKILTMSKEEVDVTLRKIKRMGKLVSGMEDALSGQRPKRSGLQRDKPDVEERSMRKELNELIKQIPMDDADLERYQKSALDAIKTRLNNRIEELQHEIDTGQKRVIERKSVELDQEAQDLVMYRDQLQKLRDEVFGKNELTDEQRIDRALKGVERAQKEIERKIADNDLERKKSKKVTSAELEQAKEKLKETRDDLQKLRDDVGILNREYNERLLSAIEKRRAKLQAKLDAKDFSTTPKREPRPRTQEADNAMAEYKALQIKWKMERQKDILRNRSGFEKFIDKSIKIWIGIGLLSGIKTLGKLAHYTAMEVFVSEPVDILTSGMAHLIPGIGKKSMTEGHVDWASRKEFYKTLLSKQTYKEAWKYAKERESYIDNLYGDVTRKIPEEFALNFGKLHGVEKYPLRKSDFAKNFIKIENYYAREGYDVSDPALRKIIGAMAYEKANYRIMMSRNFLSSALRNSQSWMMRQGTIGKASYYVSKVLFPIISVPTNYTIRTMRAWGGLGEFGVRVVKDGFGKMTPEQADKALLAFKNGMPGLALGIMILSTNLVQTDDKGALIVGGWKVPKWMTHHPYILLAQLYANAKHEYTKKGKYNKDLYHATATVPLKTLQETPYLSDRTLGIINSPTAFKDWIHNMVISWTQPQLLKDVAAMTDKQETDTKKRKPTTLVEKLKMGIPGLRQQVPFDNKSSGGYLKR